MAKADAKKPADVVAQDAEPEIDERDKRIADLEAALSDARDAATKAMLDLNDARAEIALMLESGASKVEAPARKVVRVRSRYENPAGLCMYGHQVTREGFDLDVTDFSDREMESLTGDPNLEIEA